MNNEKKPMSNTKKNLIFIAVILVLAAGLGIWGLAKKQSGDALYGLVTYQDDEGQWQLPIPLDVDKTYDIETRWETVHLQVKDGAIAFINSPCPDHLCEGFGWLDRPGAFASCIPNQVYLVVTEARDLPQAPAR